MGDVCGEGEGGGGHLKRHVENFRRKLLAGRRWQSMGEIKGAG